MARIPTYTTQSRAASQSGTPRARGIPVRDFSSRGMIEAGNSLSRIGANLLKAADDDAAHPSTSSLRPAAGIAWGRAVLYRRMLPIDPSISRCHNLLCDRGFLWAMR